MTKTGKLRPYGKWPIVIIVLLLIALLFFCYQKKKPKVFTLNSFAYDMNGELIPVPYSKLIFENENGEINAHGDVERRPKKSNPNARDDGKQASDFTEYENIKTRDLIKACFSKTNYSKDVPKLSTIGLREEDITITVLNLDDQGRLEAYDFIGSDDSIFPTFITDLTEIDNNTGNPPVGNYYAIQTALSGLDRVKVTPNDPGSIIEPRQLSQVDAEKTPFYKDFPASFPGGENGHVIFYVLGNKQLKFNRAIPVVTYAPSANVGKLYSPYFEYDLMPSQRTSSLNPPFMDMTDDLDVQVLHFMRGGTMMKGMKADKKGEIPCSYPYDLGVIALGQDIGVQDTPLLIDPEVKSKGPRP